MLVASVEDTLATTVLIEVIAAELTEVRADTVAIFVLLLEILVANVADKATT